MRSEEPDFWELVEDHQGKVLNTCYRFVRDRSEAEDLAQEVFMEIYRSREKFRGEASLSTWIYRIAVTKSIDFLRRQKRKKRFDHARRVLGLKDEPLPELEAGKGSDPEISLQDQERRAMLEEAVASLPEKQKTAVTLSKYEGFKHKEIAAIMNCSVPAVESLVQRGMQNLRTFLKNKYGKKLAEYLLVFFSNDVENLKGSIS